MLTIELYGRVCRVCMCKANNLHDLNETTEECLTMNEMLTKTVSGIYANIEFPVPHEICDLCVENLQISYRFQQLCMNSNEQMQKIWEQSQKAEVKQQPLQGGLENEDEPDPIKLEYDDDEPRLDNVGLLEEFENIENGNKSDNDTGDDEMPDKDELDHSETSVKSSSNEQYSCVECNETFTKHSQLKRHWHTHVSTHPFECQICSQRFKIKSRMHKHTKSCKKDKRKVATKSKSDVSDDNDEDEDVPLIALKRNDSENERMAANKKNKNSLPSGIKCCVKTCQKSKRHFKGLRMFKFPSSDMMLGKIWREKCRIPEKDFYKNLYICENHFSSSCVGRKKLKAEAIPTEDMGEKDEESEDSKYKFYQTNN